MNCNLYYIFHEPIFPSTAALQYNSDFLVQFVLYICAASGEDSCTRCYIL